MPAEEPLKAESPAKTARIGTLDDLVMYFVGIGSGATPAGPVLAVRPYCNNEHYWQVYFDANLAIRESFGRAGFPAPEQHFYLRGAPIAPPSLAGIGVG